jgi:hypothetical protein
MNGFKSISKASIDSITSVSKGIITLDNTSLLLHHKELCNLIHYLRYFYYECDKSLVPDYQFDLWYKDLELLESKYPYLKYSFSPTNLVNCPEHLVKYWDSVTNYGKNPYLCMLSITPLE